MFTVKEQFNGRTLEFSLGNGVSEKELQAMKVSKAFIVKRGSRTICIAGEVENGGRRHFPVIFFPDHKEAEFYCGGLLPEALKDVLPVIPSECWKGKTPSRVEVGCKHAYALTKALLTGGLTPQVIQLQQEQEKDEEDELLSLLKHTVFRAHILLWGEPGSGKTWLSFQLAEWAAKTYGAETIVIQGSPALEAPDLLGLWVKKGDSATWQDGALTKAFRLASHGKKVILIIDELPRIPAREQSILVAPLLPTPEGLVLYNPLNGETLSCPQENLWVIATGNLGEKYSSRLVDGALGERFLMVEVKTSERKMKELLSKAMKGKGWDASLVDKLIKLRTASEELVERGELSAPPSLRVFLRAIELAPTPEELPKWVALCHSQVAVSPDRAMWEELVNRVFSP